ncbi:MAG TPA: HD domain-containing protein [Solirubrobacteraceae bacterium]|jgi:3'-5' exoribonuclease|nr:HD domain-containing protein [Solirubrobacteraceae bacterium]
MAPERTISSLRAGDEVRGVYACVRKDRLKTRTGSPYLALELRDRTGSVQARAFRDADAMAGRFERGELVSVSGRVERFRDDLVVEVTDIRRAAAGGPDGDQQVAVEAFLPVAYRDMEELDGFLEHLASEVFDPGYRALLDSLLADTQIRAAFRGTPCTRNGHHAYLGGLLEHTVAVATLARELCDLHRRLNSDLLLTAAIVHDLGRTREFTYGVEIGLTEAGRLLGHLTLGQQLLSERFERLGGNFGLDEARRLALLHCVLAHHGPSGVPGGRFASAEALALYRANALDAGVKAALEHGLGPAQD